MLLTMVPEENVSVNNLVQTIVQHLAFWVTIHSILMATNQKQSASFVPIASAEIPERQGSISPSSLRGNCSIISYTC